LIREQIPFFTETDQKKIMGRNAIEFWGFERE